MKKTKTLSFLALLITIICAFAAFTFVGCKPNKDTGVKITLSLPEVNVTEGKTATVVATVKGSKEDIVWSVGDNTIATITPNKKVVTIKGEKVGTTTLTAAIGETKASCKVNVKADNTEKVTITLDGTEITETSVEKGSTKTLVATASLGSPITWETSNAKIVSVENGVITGVNGGTATVTAKVTASIKAEVTVTVTGGAELKELKNTGADGATANAGTWTYWAESWVTVEEAYSVGNDVTIKFLNNDSDSPSFFYATQLFYKNADLTSDHIYKLTFDYDSPSTGKITMNGNVITLEQGKHSYTTYYTEGATSISIQLGVNGLGMQIKEGTLEISNLAWVEDSTTEQLTAPSFTYNNDTGVITITDTANVKGSVGKYALYFYNDENEVQGNTTVVSGEKVDLGTIPNGTWTAKLVAVGANIHYTNSEPSASGVQITVANDKTLITNGEEHDSYVNPGAWYEWHDKGYNGSTVTVSDAYIDGNGAIHFSFTISGSNQFNEAAHLYYHYSTCTPGTLYTLTMNINATAGCTVDICGVKKTLEPGDNNISVPFTQPAENPDWEGKTKGATIRMYFNDDNTYVISNVKVEEAQSTPLTAPSFTIASNVITITDSNAAGVGKYELGFFQSEELKATVDVTTGNEIDLSKVPAGEYTVKLRAVGESALYVTSDWSSTTATITSNNQNTPIGYSEEGTLTSGWAYWDSKAAADWNQWTAANCSECYMDGDGTITMTYTCEGTGAAWTMQMFYKANDGAEKWNSTITIKADVNCTITVCGQTVELVANTEQNVPVTNYKSTNGSAIDIQFGTTGGTFTIKSNTTAANS